MPPRARRFGPMTERQAARAAGRPLPRPPRFGPMTERQAGRAATRERNAARRAAKRARFVSGHPGRDVVIKSYAKRPAGYTHRLGTTAEVAPHTRHLPFIYNKAGG